MAYDAALAERIRNLLAGEDGVREKAMFGGLAFLVDGHMAVAAAGSTGGMMLRIDPGRGEEFLGEHIAPMEMRGRTMTGWLDVQPEAISTDAELEELVAIGVSYARSLPPK
ncbi:TfoX/Sxy family protein [Ornithinimicrobium sp. Y1847]|uniref:TfoX/Sxy family protein n=1 Tax=Ornithinimicrobium sp. Y1847 TaxID=3405419 RepID=UPI003B6834C2